MHFSLSFCSNRISLVLLFQFLLNLCPVKLLSRLLFLLLLIQLLLHLLSHPLFYLLFKLLLLLLRFLLRLLLFFHLLLSTVCLFLPLSFCIQIAHLLLHICTQLCLRICSDLLHICLISLPHFSRSLTSVLGCCRLEQSNERVFGLHSSLALNRAMAVNDLSFLSNSFAPPIRQLAYKCLLRYPHHAVRHFFSLFALLFAEAQLLLAEHRGLHTESCTQRGLHLPVVTSKDALLEGAKLLCKTISVRL
mmetsp:Transcript_30929/g.81226  ORF Transcript_30929/g.81226 Transcript_30929/m.81226 type:complete len:248 (-) Transcript_30929:916-1659(-)